MIVRQRLDIGWSDLAAGLVACLGSGRRHDLERRLAASAPCRDGAAVVTALSVRSGLDALLSVLDLPAGSEVLVSAVTIRDMPALLRLHGLVVVPVDVEPDSLAPTPWALAAAVTPATRAVLVAHLFGQRLDMAPVHALARRHGLLVLEDCAQALGGEGDPGHPDSDVRLYSFGMIKTATALGGALLALRDERLGAAVAAQQERWPVRSRGVHARRLWKAGLLQALGSRALFGAFVRGCGVLGVDHDRLLGASVRGFPGDDLLAGLRQRPCLPLLTLLARRLETLDRAALRARVTRAETLLARLDGVPRPGAVAHARGHWVVPVLADDPDALVARLRVAGFDATRGATSLAVVQAPPGRPAARAAASLLARIVYLPCHAGLSPTDLERLATAVRDHFAETPS